MVQCWVTLRTMSFSSACHGVHLEGIVPYTNFAKLSRHVWGEGLRYDAPLERSYEEALELSFEAFVA